MDKRGEIDNKIVSIKEITWIGLRLTIKGSQFLDDTALLPYTCGKRLQIFTHILNGKTHCEIKVCCKAGMFP